MAKPAEKPAVPGRPFAKGEDARRNTTIAGPGRPTDAFRKRMAALADRAVQALEVADILDDPNDPLYLPAAKWAAEHGYGKPDIKLDVSDDVAALLRELRDARDRSNLPQPETPDVQP